MTNSQSRQAVDRVIRNLYFELSVDFVSVDFVPESNLSNILILLYICSSNLKRDFHFRKNPENSISFESRTMFATGF